MIRTGKELAAACKKVAENYKTLYINGCIGAPMTDSAKERYTKNQNYNKNPERTPKILAASEDTFGFDCVCLIKSMLWGWSGDTGKTYGGAVYASNGVPDIGEAQMIDACSEVSRDFSRIAVGEAVWMPGHIGVYIGNGLAVECTPAWDDGVQITAVHNIAAQDGYNGRYWVKHGKLPYVNYDAKNDATTAECYGITMRLLKRGCTGEDVRALQILLMGRGEKLPLYGDDGDFGAETEAAVTSYQRKNGLAVDGEAGPETMSWLMGVST